MILVGSSGDGPVSLVDRRREHAEAEWVRQRDADVSDILGFRVEGDVITWDDDTRRKATVAEQRMWWLLVTPEAAWEPIEEVEAERLLPTVPRPR